MCLALYRRSATVLGEPMRWIVLDPVILAAVLAGALAIPAGAAAACPSLKFSPPQGIGFWGAPRYRRAPLQGRMGGRGRRRRPGAGRPGVAPAGARLHRNPAAFPCPGPEPLPRAGREPPA